MYKCFMALFFSIVIFFVISYGNEYFKPKDDLYRAQQYILEKEWFLAESLLQKFLRIENNADKRWTAWMHLLSVSNYLDVHPATVHIYLSDMLQEFFDDPIRKKFVVFSYAKILQEYGDYAVASDMWNMYLELHSLTPIETFDAYRNLAAIYFRTRQYILLEDVLYSCLALELPSYESAQCMYDLAYMKSSREEWSDTSDLLEQILAMEIDDYTRALSTFLMADILEQQKKYEESLSFFQQTRLFHPNIQAVDKRIEFLQKKLK